MRFAVFADLHYDVMPDGDRRVHDLLHSFEKNKVDFAIDLGDSISADPKNETIMKRFKDYPCFFSIGNHNLDFCANETALRFTGLEKGYYSVVRENVKFIFLDANYVKTPDGYLHEDNASDVTGLCRPYIPPVQIEWLRNELENDDLFYIICTHQGLTNELTIETHSRGIINRDEIRVVLEKRNSDGRKILFCMNGHDHGDAIHQINGIHYYSLTAASFVWQPKEIYAYDKETHDRFPYLKNFIVYADALHIIVDIDAHMNVHIQGMESHYQRVTPEDVGMTRVWNNVSIEPRTSSLYIPSPLAYI